MKGGVFTIYDKVLVEHQRIKEKISSLESILKKFPKENLICARNGNHYKWYQSDGRTIKYLPKKNLKLAEELALKKYLSLSLKDLNCEKQALDSYLSFHDSHTGKSAETLLTVPEYQKLLSPYFTPKTQELTDWLQAPYEHNPNYPEQLIHKTSSGHYVRSKSEAMIDMVLHMQRIPFRYECPLNLGDTIVYPDFTIRHPITNQIYYWEHFGLMDDPIYCRNVSSKMQLYTSHGIIPTIHLITTYETKAHPLSTDTVENLVKHYFC